MQRFELLDPYVQLILMYVGINIILTVSLNLVNGYMGEFSVGHAGFMAVGAYVASLLTVKLLPAAIDRPALSPGRDLRRARGSGRGARRGLSLFQDEG